MTTTITATTANPSDDPPCRLLWIELQAKTVGDRLGNALAVDFPVNLCRHPDRIPALIAELRPSVICFEFDQPDISGLRVLRETKLTHPSLPILMLSDPPTAELALWALRTRVWDYFVKPVTCGEIARRINILTQVSRAQRTCNARPVFMPQQVLPGDNGLPSRPARAKNTEPALSYIDANPHYRLSLADAAARCAMGPYEFSREFKREHGMTFRDFVIHTRIALAAARLREPDAVIMDIALATGFNDASHFTRTFRRHVGLTPAAYRLRAQQTSAHATRATLPEGDWNVRSDGCGHTMASVV